jgi:hypothetical protein
MTEQRNELIASLSSSSGATLVSIAGRIRYPAPKTKLERAQAYAADVRARRGMVVRKGVYLDPIK